MLITVREASPSLRCLWLNPLIRKPSKSFSICRPTFSVRTISTTSNIFTSCDLANFDPLGINTDTSSTWKNLVSLFPQTFESSSSTEKEKSNSSRGVAAAIEDSSIDFGDFFKGPLPGKFLKLLGFLALSRLGVYIPLGGVNREAFLGNLDQNSLLSTLDSFSGGGIGRLGLCSLGIVPFINAQIVFQLLAQVYPKLQDLQKREGEAGRKKILQYTRYASVGFAIVQDQNSGRTIDVGCESQGLYYLSTSSKAIGQVLFLRPYVNDFTTEWALTSVILLTLGSVFTTYIGEQITDLKLGNGTSLLIFTNIISYLPASFGRTFAQAFNDANYVGLATIIVSFFLLVVGIVYVQEAERKIPINYASRFTSRSSGLEKSAYLPFKVNSSGVMPIIFSTSSLALPGTLARFTGVSALKTAAVALNPGGSFYLPFNIFLIAFFNYYYTFLQLDPDDVSEQLKRQGASIPLVRPGRSTATFIKTVLSRISVLGSTFLAILAAGPALVEQTTHLTAFRGFAGTSILILVGCATDTARKVRAEIISQKYKNIELYDFDKY
ncbi:preprotein translocase subunit SECY, chloroplastic isoform X2 [Cicer arietinum]|uniref:preprotein translocase subunit SECY, chloroplastic isoform X1 n=1 Tax=Cicer arietinum TaxID=3827 RepID=UPI00032AAB19